MRQLAVSASVPSGSLTLPLVIRAVGSRRTIRTAVAARQPPEATDRRREGPRTETSCSGVEQEFYVGPWLVEPLINRISGGEQSHRVEPKVMDVLVLLSQHPGRVVSRETLFEKVWAGIIVTDDVLTRSISELRKVFGDDPRNPEYIETIPKAGYRLIAPVADRLQTETVGDKVASEGTGHPAAAAKAKPVIARMRVGLLVLAIGVLSVSVWALLQNPEPVSRPLYPTPVTTYPGRESRPSLSPDGRQVAFSWSGERDNSVDVYVKYVDAAPTLRLTNEATPNTNPVWSPDGTEIAFMSRGATCDICIVSAIGGSARTLGSCGAGIYGDLAWSPDGAWLAFNDRPSASQPFSIHLMSVATGLTSSVTRPPSGIWGDHDPFFSPDGRQLGFVRSASEGMQDVFVTDVSGGEERRLTSEARNVWGGAWTADGRKIIIASNRTGRPGLWSMDATGGQLRWLGVQSPAAGFPSIAGDRLAFLQVDFDVNLWRVPLAAHGDPALFAPSTHWDLHPAISPDGSQVAFSSNRSGSYEVWVADSSGGSLRQLTKFGGPFTSAPRWSPDGRRIAFTGRSDGNADIFVISLATSGTTRITTSTADDLAPSWSLDGQDIVFTSNRGGDWEAWSVSANGGVARQLTFSGAFGARMLPKSGQLVFSRPSEPGLWIADVQRGSEIELVPDVDPRDWGSWDVAGTDLYYVRREAGIQVLRRNLQNGLVDTAFTAINDVPVMDPAISLSPDGTWMLIGQVDRRESDIMMVELKR